MGFRRHSALTGALILSVATHLAVPAAPEGYRRAKTAAQPIVEHIQQTMQRGEIWLERFALVMEARQQLRDGTFVLGEFGLKADEIAAREAGENLDISEARRRYYSYLAALQDSTSTGRTLEQSIPIVLHDMRYYGGSSERMADMLLRGGGACMATSFLVASLAYDVGGYENKIFLRNYAPNGRGIGHRTAVFLDNSGRFFDLLRGDYAYRGTETYSPAEYVERYAARYSIPGDYDESQERRNSSRIDYSAPGGAPLFSRGAVGEYRPNAAHVNQINRETDTLPTHLLWPMLETVELISRRDDELASQAQHPDLQPIEFLLLTYVETEPQQPEPQLLEPPGVVINRIETRMEELSVAADGVRVWLRNYDFTHGGQAPAGGALDRITLLAYLSRIYQKISEEADREELQDRYSFIVEEARAGRDQAIEEALALIDTLPEEIKANIYSVPEYLSEDTNTMINRWYIALLGERGEDLLMRSIERCNATEHERAQCDRSPPTSLSFRLALLLNQSTHERMLRVISRMPRGYQLDMVDDCIRDGVLGFDCRDSIETDQNSEFYRVYRAYNELRSNPRFERTIVDPNQDETVYYLERAVLDPANFERTPISFDEFREIVRATRVRYDLDSQWETAFIIRFGFDFASQNTHLQLGPNQDRVGGATELAFFVPLRAWCLTLRDPLVSSDDIESLDFIIHRCHQ